MKTEYHVSRNGKIVGIFTLEELIDKKFSEDVLVWYQGQENWLPIKDIEHLKEAIRITPPPLPSSQIDSAAKAEITLKPSDRSLMYFLIWAGLHSFALITSYAEINIFSDRPRESRFWPFVRYTEYHPGWVGVRSQTEFLGVFNNYDWSEFLVYVGGAALIYTIVKLSK